MKEAPLTEGGLSDPSGRFFRLSPRLSGAHRGPSKRDAIWARAMYWLARAPAAGDRGRSAAPDLRRWPGLLADLLDERPRAAAVRGLVVHDLHEQPRLRVRREDRRSVRLACDVQAFGRDRPLRSRGGRGRRPIVRRLRLGDVAEPGRGVGAPARAVAAGTDRGQAGHWRL